MGGLKAPHLRVRGAARRVDDVGDVQRRAEAQRAHEVSHGAPGLPRVDLVEARDEELQQRRAREALRRVLRMEEEGAGRGARR